MACPPRAAKDIGYVKYPKASSGILPDFFPLESDIQAVPVGIIGCKPAIAASWLAHPQFLKEMYGASDISSVQAEGVSGHNRKTVVPSWVRRDHSCFLYRGPMGEILLLFD